MATFLVFGLASCSKKTAFLSSSVAPASRGDVSIKTDKNKNQAIKINISNLAEPERLTPPKQMYMVWMETDQAEIKNLGQIKTSDGTFSKALKAKFETVTTFKPSIIFITAEDDPNTTYPSYERVLTTSKINN
jgi:hypothetical protein